MEDSDHSGLKENLLTNKPIASTSARERRKSTSTLSVEKEEYDAAVNEQTWSKMMIYRHRFSFFFMGICALSLQSFINVIANKALGAGKFASLIFLFLYIPQVTLRIFADYWTKALSYHVRILLTAGLDAIGLILLYTFMDKSSSIPDESLMHAERLLVLLSVLIIGAASSVGEVTSFGYTTFFHPSCINFQSAGNGFGAFLGATIALIQNLLHFDNKHIVIGCFAIPSGLLVAYFLGLTHSHTRGGNISVVVQPDDHDVDDEVEHGSEMRDMSTTNRGQVEVEVEIRQHVQGEKNKDDMDDIRTRKIGAIMTLKLLAVDLFKYTFPLVSVYFLYNVMLGGFIAPSFDVLDDDGVTIPAYKEVYQYFVMSMRLGVFLGKSSGFLQVRRLWVFPGAFVVATVVASLIAYAPKLMHWIILESGGHWMLWVLACPLGWFYGASSANILYILRKECPVTLKEFALSNTTLAGAVGQLTGNIVAIGLSETVPKRYEDMQL